MTRHVYDQAVKPATFLPAQIRWTPDSKGFYFTAPYTTHPKYDNASINLLYYYDLAAKTETKVDLAWPNGLAFAYTLVKEGVLATLANGARNKPALYTRSGSTWKKNEIQCENCSNIFSLESDSGSSLILYRHSRANVPDQIFSATLADSTLQGSKQLTDLNSGWKKRLKAYFTFPTLTNRERSILWS
jgi:prolyl oligopeptidase PreP (S9A serine peptidase family)